MEEDATHAVFSEISYCDHILIKSFWDSIPPLKISYSANVEG